MADEPASTLPAATAASSPPASALSAEERWRQYQQRSDDNEQSPMLEDKQSTIEIDEIADASIAIESLPPLPLPDTATIRQEQATGWMIVGGAILGCLLVAHAAHFIAGDKRTRTECAGFLALVYIEACVAMILVGRLLDADPGVVVRTRTTCFPVPNTEIRKRILAGESLDGMDNVHDPIRGVYCVRCLVWRPHEGSGPGTCCTVRSIGADGTHHCRTCQRCVVRFDHHCRVFGRCIGGTCLQGNIIYFYAVITIGVLGAGTAGSSFTAALASRGDIKIIEGVAITYGSAVGLFLLAVVFGCCFRMLFPWVRDRYLYFSHRSAPVSDRDPWIQ